jgi:cytochrome c oxidase subunit 6b
MSEAGDAPAAHVSSGKLPGTAEYDPRFPNTNQSKFCWTNYVDYHRCARIKGAEDPVCKTFQKNFTSTCPNEWVSRLCCFAIREKKKKKKKKKSKGKKKKIVLFVKKTL